MKMFAKEATIEVSSKNSKRKTRHKVSDYFQRLMNLNYAAVNIKFTKKWVSNVRKNHNGGYHLKGYYTQHFQGLKNSSNQSYDDLTDKEVDVDIFTKKGIHGTGLKILFGNTRVLWTR